eukprot:gnl/TRDRNA2_/TRDRNA2_184587_c0_seq1.p1 gnl/TRDRNA2_/TRDRNA2_184587_c0~~gnl/TRDRNA2_/TRDRNA2_184587_c0_seq1.p1  ORF type:complete len:298 (-),score=87.21 gnl/TRDRNA2_/TRDRNA2_184587_c0_seq1:204-1097(-)
MDDELQEVRDNFYVGNFNKVLQMCENAKLSDDISQSECDAIIGRSCLSRQEFEKLKAMQNAQCPGQKAAALMAVLTKSKNEQQRSAARDKLLELTKETQDVSCAALSASALAQEGQWNDAVQMTQAHLTLDMQALKVFILLMCHQTDMAEKTLNAMQGNNDDSAIFRLASAAVHLATGNPEEAYLIYCDLASQFPAQEGEDGSTSVLLQVGKAVGNMMRQMFGEAVEDLQRAHATAPNDPDVLVNLVCCMTHLAKKDEAKQYLAKLQQVDPLNPHVRKMESMQQAFARFKASRQAGV